MSVRVSSPSEANIAFVAGATGYTGREVVRALCDQGVRTIAHIRPSSSRRDEWQGRFEQFGAEVDFTPWESPALAATFEKLSPTLVFALLGITRKGAKLEAKDGASRPTYDSVDYGLTAMLIEASRRVTPRPRFIYLSSAGLPSGEPTAGSYMHARWRIEKELEASDLPYIAARPSFITGSDRDDSRPGERIGATVADRALSLAGVLGMKRLRDRYQSTTNVALANALVRLGLDESQARVVVESESLR
jgi:nucleoside-diphosphate-sugar epimerase